MSARDALPQMLRDAGVEVDVVPVYRTVPASPEKAADLIGLLERGELDVVLFTSSSTVDNVVELLGARATELLARVTVASIGPITSETLEANGVRVDVRATEYTVDGLLDALEAHFGGR